MRIVQWLIVLLLPLFVYAQEGNQFESMTVNFKITKPSDWQFVTAQENLENLKKVQMKDDEYKQHVLKYSTAPLVAMTKYPEPFEDLNPSIKVNIKPLGQLKGVDPKQILGLILPQFQKMFQDFNLVQPPMDTKVGSLNAAYVRINYTLEIPDGRAFPTSSQLWIVPRGDYFFLIGAGTRQDEKTGSREEIEKILSTIVL
ncbi:MAG: hypothetical protein KU37_03455 [Sulfuricurvum sp. PC08-66]|nr:MAG: hypothetical protein KU37_03455 [Sulfuricurvum sp. PC08-66]